MSYKYLAIGNSITIHGKCNYWFGTYGMAASKPENDYVHRVKEYLSCNGGADVEVFNYYLWEIQAFDRSETFLLLDKYMNQSIDLITIQLSENVMDTNTFCRDYRELLLYIKNKCPMAKLIGIDDFWSGEKSAMKEEIHKDEEIDFVNLSNIRNNIRYTGNPENKYMGDDGVDYVIDHAGVLKHPNDIAMKYIADKIIRIIEGL